MCLPRSCEYCVKPCVWAPGACRPDDLHLGPTTCVRAAPPTCMSSGLGAYQGVQAHFQGLTCGRAAEGETELVRHCRCGAYSVTKFARQAPVHGISGIKLSQHTRPHRLSGTKLSLHARNGPIWRNLRMQGEFCTVLTTKKPSRESFVPNARQRSS